MAVHSAARRSRPVAVAAAEQFLLFRVGDESYGVGLPALWEVLSPEGVTALATPPHQACSALAYRGHRLPLVRLAALFGAPADHVPPSARVLLLEARGRTVGVLVDQVLEVVDVPAAAIAPMPAQATLLDPRLLRGVCSRGRRVLVLLHAEGLGELPEVVRFQGEGQPSVAS